VLTMLGLGSRTELLGRPATSFFDLKAQAADSLRAAILNDTPACFQAIRLVGNKTHGPRVDLTVNPVPGLDDNQVGHMLVMSDATRRLETESQLNRETRRLENILRGTDAGTWEWDLETNMLDVNDRWLTLIGHDENEPRHLTIDRWRELVHPDDVSLANERLAAHAAGQTDYYEVEFRMRHRDGHWVWILSRGKVMEWDESGRPKQFAGTHLDITALKRAQASELEEKSKFEALFDGLNDAVFVHPVEPFGYANFLEVNPVACERYGFTRDELLRRSPADLRDPDATQNLGSSSQLEVLMRTGHLLYETRHQAKGGRRFPVEISTKLFDYNGTQALMSLVRDISARKHNEAKILQATAMFDRSNEGIVVTDRDRRIISVNPAFERLTGYSRDEAIGRNPRFLQSGRHDEAFYRDLWHELECNGSWQGEIWNRRKGGELILEWQTITAVEDETGEVTNYISIFSDITRAKKSEEEVHYLSWHDPLTGLANRRQLENDLREVLDASGHAAVFYIDIDRFKQVNDSFGHAAGDDMLRQLARRMEDAVPEGGKLARFSGDEFVMLSQVDSVEKADDQARSLLERIDQPISLEGVDVALTATVGIAIGPEDGGDAPTLLRHAHSALHESKRSGRNTHTVYSPGTPNYSREKMLLESSLRLALEREDFVVCYQPQVDMRTGAIIGSEALVRWRPPNEPEISPGEFIPVAEDSGLIVALGEWVLRRACEESMSHARPEGKPRRVAVNLSGRQLIEKDIVGTVDKVLKETGMPPDSLELEVTETFLVEHRGAVDTLLGLKKLGVRLSIDDFGTGHSSLARLKELPVDKLKIDQAFVRGITGDNSDAAIARAIIALGNSLGMDVLAEGVENGDQGQFLIREGCFHGQGFLFGRAVNAEDILPLDQIEGGSVLSNGVRAGCAPQASSPFTPHC
ncbi:MAG: EAL domain-containing protein, partial [Guyparkeria sp.]|uniref:bifunctional diguanylate cyclase/phosphodiesterase n=1 Tax=Guyparkeria sp. TaxID=2035736 RepID=UPI00397B6299